MVNHVASSASAWCMMSVKREARQSLGKKASGIASSFYTGQLLGVMITALTFMLITRILGPSGYGVYVFAFGFAALVDAVSLFGIGTYVSRNIARAVQERDNKAVSKTVSEGYALLLPIALLLSLIGVGLSHYVAITFNMAGSGLALTLASLYIFFSMLESTSVHMLLGFGNGRRAAGLNLFVDVTQLISSVALALAFSVKGAVAGTLIGYVLGALLAVYSVYAVLRRQGIRLALPTRAGVVKALGFSAPLGANNFLNTTMQSLAIILLGLYVSKTAIGNYGVAVKGLTLISVAYSSMATLLLPIFAASGVYARRKKSIYSKIFLYSLVVTMPLVLYTAVFSKAGVYLLLSQRYSNAPLYLTLMAMGIMISLPSFYLASLIISEGYTRKILKYNLVVFLAEGLSLSLLASRLGPIGNIISIFFIGGILQDIFMVRIAKRLIGLNLYGIRIARLYISSALLSLILMPLMLIGRASAELALGLIATLILYPLLLFISGVIDKKDIDIIRRATEDMPLLSRLIALPLKAFGRFVSGAN